MYGYYSQGDDGWAEISSGDEWYKLTIEADTSGGWVTTNEISPTGFEAPDPDHFTRLIATIDACSGMQYRVTWTSSEGSESPDEFVFFIDTVCNPARVVEVDIINPVKTVTFL